MITSCHLPNCTEASHVVLFASGAEFARMPTRPAERIILCLRHGGEVYDLIRANRLTAPNTPVKQPFGVRLPAWLHADYMSMRLPRITPDPRGWADSRPVASSWSSREFRANPKARA
jgi:hypothetical protein